VGTDGSAVNGDIVNSAGQIDRAAYVDMASKLGTDTGIAYRYGARSSASGMPTLPAPTNNPYPTSSPYAPDSADDPVVMWQIGGPYQTDAGNYSSNQGQYAFVPDDPARYAGIGTLELLAQRNNTFSEVPQPSWTFPPEVALAPVGKNDYYNAKTPVALGRCYGSVCAQTVMAFADGTVGTFGSNTTDWRASIKLDAGKTPTAVALTNAGEFALITVWDTVNLKGQVAVVAMSGSQIHEDWPADYPGLQNLGTFHFMKLLGYIDLPGMAAPTEISATTGLDYDTVHWLFPPSGSGCASNWVRPDMLPLNVEANRKTFMPGGCNYDKYAHGGVAVVVSKSERKAMFLNLKPLFDYYQSMYFGDIANFNQTANLGQSADQWPYPFSKVTSQVPTVIKTIDLAQRPTAVKAALSNTSRAFIATEDGTLNLFSLGNYTAAGGAAAGDIALKGTVAVGKNPTSLAYPKHDATGGGTAAYPGLIVVSRAESKIQWVGFNADYTGGSIRRTLQDSRLKDPITAEDNDNMGTESFILTVSDYAGRKVSNYRYGAVTFPALAGGACQSGCGTDAFEYGGSYAVPGGVFSVTGANVP